MLSKTKINKRIKKKTNSELVETIFLAKKHNQEVASLLSVPTRKRISLNLEELDKESKENDVVIVPGKVLGDGEINKKIKIIAFSFSESAAKKLEKAKCKITTIKEELERNKKLEGKILK